MRSDKKGQLAVRDHHTGASLGIKILSALGMQSDHIRSVTVYCEAGKPALVTVESYVPRDDPRFDRAMAESPYGEWPTVFDRYELVKK